ncbi:GNAT family N-acetyltransferase [Mycobacterium manitobense]|uniref:GNAT family N-acetyltransferase n=1 Tax=[Mycobacterium] manitobense TaxID=190147 RepID=A0A9X3BU57_9MYCO|nr:GNAT family N-acetyltransferase [[Mycobacterium] manitobense]
MTGYSTPRPISEIDDAATFDSGEPTLDDYLRKRALANHVGGASRCFVTCRDGRIVGYYALSTGAVSHADCTGKFRRNMPDPIPVILLSRLAIDRKHQGCGLGENLLRDAIARSVQVAQDIGVRAILVHALHDRARSFYTRYQFELSPTDPLHLMLLIKDAKASVPALQEDWDTARRELTEAMVETGADRDHLESLTNEQFRRLMAIMALTHANELRKLMPDGADDALAAAREATGFTDKALRSVTLPDGSALLIDADCEHADDEIHDALEGDD